MLKLAHYGRRCKGNQNNINTTKSWISNCKTPKPVGLMRHWAKTQSIKIISSNSTNSSRSIEFSTRTGLILIIGSSENSIQTSPNSSCHIQNRSDYVEQSNCVSLKSSEQQIQDLPQRARCGRACSLRKIRSPRCRRAQTKSCPVSRNVPYGPRGCPPHWRAVRSPWP